jgi:hypothetical protein
MSKERLTRQYFTRAEAEAKVGQQIQTRVEFSSVPRGTTGQVISADEAGWAKPPFGEAEEAYDVAIQWDLPRPEPFADLVFPTGAEPYIHIQTGKPLVDWSTKDEYERYLDEVAPGSAQPE